MSFVLHLSPSQNLVSSSSDSGGSSVNESQSKQVRHPCYWGVHASNCLFCGGGGRNACGLNLTVTSHVCFVYISLASDTWLQIGIGKVRKAWLPTLSSVNVLLFVPQAGELLTDASSPAAAASGVTDRRHQPQGGQVSAHATTCGSPRWNSTTDPVLQIFSQWLKDREEVLTAESTPCLLFWSMKYNLRRL